MSNTWETVMKYRKNDKRHIGVANTLTKDEIETIACLVDFFGGNAGMVVFDLQVAKYRLFDWIAMCVMGNRIDSVNACKVLAYSFIKCKGNIDKFIEDLRITDYDVITDWESLEL